MFLHEQQMTHTTHPYSHHWHLSIRPTLTTRIVSRRRGNGFEVSGKRRGQLASRRSLLQSACYPYVSLGGPQSRKTLGPNLRTANVNGYRVMDHDPYTVDTPAPHSHLFGPLTKAPSWQAICNTRRTE